MTHRLIVEVRGALKRSANPVKATQMQAYMKSAMPYRGVSSPEQKAIWKAVFTAHPLRSGMSRGLLKFGGGSSDDYAT